MTQHFPTCPAYLVPVEIKETPQYGKGHKGVFATEPIAKGTKMWVWTDRVTSIHHDDLEDYIATNFGTNLDKIRVFLQQGFVLPPSSSETLGSGSSSGNSNSDDDFFHSNPTDSGRLTNHSSVPNTGPEGALRDILPGEELTIDYSFHGNPEWYRTICAKYGVETEAQVAASCQS
eukprot:jgi/Psemu1/264715/estExt_Genewise1Plus.C_21970014